MVLRVAISSGVNAKVTQQLHMNRPSHELHADCLGSLCLRRIPLAHHVMSRTTNTGSGAQTMPPVGPLTPGTPRGWPGVVGAAGQPQPGCQSRGWRQPSAPRMEFCTAAANPDDVSRLAFDQLRRQVQPAGADAAPAATPSSRVWPLRPRPAARSRGRSAPAKEVRPDRRRRAGRGCCPCAGRCCRSLRGGGPARDSINGTDTGNRRPTTTPPTTTAAGSSNNQRRTYVQHGDPVDRVSGILGGPEVFGGAIVRREELKAPDLSEMKRQKMGQFGG